MKTILSKIRNAFIFAGSHAFARPYLPDALIWIGLVLAATGASLTLVAQPYYYWFDFQRALMPVGFIGSLLKVSPLLYIGAGLLYLAALWLVYKFVTRPAAFLIWFPISFMNLYLVLAWLSGKLFPADPSQAGVQDTVIGFIAVFLLALSLVLLLFRRSTPVAARPQGWRSGLPRGLIIFWGIVLTVVIVVTAIHPWSGWQLIRPKHSPGPRAMAAVAYDPLRKNTILFGGISEFFAYGPYYRNDTWAWDGRDWKELHPNTSPSPRNALAMAYDEKNNVIVLFGGEGPGGNSLGDTWIWDGQEWSQATSEDSPAARRDPVMFYDPKLEKVILTGGFALYASEKNPHDLQDVWEWDGKIWSPLPDSPMNAFLRNPGSAYNAATQQTVEMNYNGLWVWQSGQWSQQNAVPLPPSRLNTWLAAAPAGDVLMFGGTKDNAALNDTWRLRAGRWEQLSPWALPSARNLNVLFYDPVSRGYMLYGGLDDQNKILGDMWAFPAR